MTSSVADREAGAFERARDDLRRVLTANPVVNILIVGDRVFFLAPSHKDSTRLRNLSGLVCRLTGEPCDHVCLGMVVEDPHDDRQARALQALGNAICEAMGDGHAPITFHIV